MQPILTIPNYDLMLIQTDTVVCVSAVDYAIVV